MILYMGIDPGLSGCCVVLGHDGSLVIDLPVVANGTRREFLPVAFAKSLRRYVKEVGADQIFCSLEKHTPRPGQGISSQCKSANITGNLEGMLAMAGISYEIVHPARWAKVMRDVPGKDKKARSVMAASRRWPTLDLSRKRDHNRADAALIAEYGRLNRE